MTQTLESFIDRLRTDGVESGQKAAEEIRREAQREAEKLLRDAEAKAQQIIREAEAQREQTLARTQIDLRLAARDTMARLRETLSQAVNRVLEKAVSQKLENTEFIAELIRQIAQQYAGADATGDAVLTVNVSDPMRQRLAHWAIETFHTDKKQTGLSVELHGSLTGAGFEYKMTEGTVEITAESVVQVLSEIVTPELRKLIVEATGDSGDSQTPQRAT
jgi:vacuolar-type H+-ATPase subunit E/Vma4